MAIVAALTALVVVPLLVIGDEFIAGAGGWLRDLALLMLLAIGVVAFYGFMRRIFAPTRNEMVQTMFVLLFVAFVVLTVTGIWFRGAGMALVWPWQS